MLSKQLVVKEKGMLIHTIIADAGKKQCMVVIKSTFRLYRNDLESIQTLFELSNRIFRETKLEVNLLLRGDKTLHLISRKKIPKEALLRKVEMAVKIMTEVYGTQARVQIQQGLF